MKPHWKILLALAFSLALAGCNDKVLPDPGPGPDVPQPPVPDPNLPVADLLDLAFLPDGTAEDRSPKGMRVETVAGARLLTYADPRFGRQVAHFSNALEANVRSSYFKVDYSADTAFKDALADGHSWETLVRIDESPAGHGEIKFFTATQSGGTGFLISNAAKGNCFSFIPNTGSWNWAQSTTQPEAGRYYHLVGVFDNEQGVSQIYVNGVLQASVENSSHTFKHANASFQYVVIGGDPGGDGCTNAWKGDIVLARIYDKVLTAEEITALAGACPLPEQPDPLPALAGLHFPEDAAVRPGWKLNLYAEGFQAGDGLRLDGPAVLTPSVAVASDHLALTVPDGFVAGNYRMFLLRGQLAYPLGNVTLSLSEADEPVFTQAVAHRGAYKQAGYPQNSIAALRAVAPLGIYASELDVWITRDDVPVVCHDATFPKDEHVIQDSRMADLTDVRLTNGEAIPTLESFIVNAKELGIRLVIELKQQKATSDKLFSASQNNERLVDACVALVKQYDYVAMCDWIGFDYASCQRIAAALPGSCVQYLNGDKSPAQCYAGGLSGIDYKAADLTPAWIREAHSLGMVVNVWTIDNADEMRRWIEYGVDFITTNEPELCKKLADKKFVEK